jgi:ABC-type Zn uptake system ZnuABC Zn-binding protein ZnuA
VDPENAKTIARHLATAFGSLDPPNAESYRTKADRFVGQLETKLAEWQKTLAPFKGAPIVAYHNSWPYFARRFGLVMEIYLEPKPGIPPSPAHLAEVVAKIKQQNIRVIFVDAYLNRRTAETAARDTGATVVEVSQFPGGVKGTEDGYIALLDYLVNSTAKALGNKR